VTVGPLSRKVVPPHATSSSRPYSRRRGRCPGGRSLHLLPRSRDTLHSFPQSGGGGYSSGNAGTYQRPGQIYHFGPVDASYSVHEDLIFGGVGSNTAVGTTSGVSGSFFLGLSGAVTLTQVKISVDLTGLQSNSSLRDGHVQDYLDTSQFPNADFTSTNVKGLPATYTPGQTISFQIVGNLKLHGVTNAETFNAQGKLSGNEVTGTATTTIFMTDFGVTPPDLANIAIVDNKVTLTINFTAQK
jgi:polyisoprenoid-binding protein YceI